MPPSLPPLSDALASQSSLTRCMIPESPGLVKLESLIGLFRDQKQYLSYFFDNLDIEAVQRFANTCKACQGVLFFSGVGKSGFVVQKISQTLVSTGTKAVFLNPTDALHGDIGIVSPEDLVVLFSKSGSTDELIKLAPFAKAKGAKLIAVTCAEGSKLGQLCDEEIILPLERELCPFDLAPVTSTGIQMLFGDTVAIALMNAKHLSKEEYAMNHPAGRIGKRLMLTVEDVMRPVSQVPTCEPSLVIVDCLVQLCSGGLGCVLVTDPNTSALLGCFTDGDLRRCLRDKGEMTLNLTVEEVMTRSPRTILSSAMAVDALTEIESNSVNFLPVINDEGKLKGLVTLHGLLNAGL